MDKNVRVEKMCESVWGFASKIVGEEMSYEDLMDCFGTSIAEEIFSTYTYKEALRKYVLWNAKEKEKFEIGDEVYTDAGEIGVVVGSWQIEESPMVLGYNRKMYGYITRSSWHKSGNRYPAFVATFDALCDNREKLLEYLRSAGDDEE